MPENERLRARIDEIEAGYLARADQNRAAIASIRRVIVWTVTFVLLVLFALGGSGFYLRGQQSELAHSAKDQAQRATQIAAAVQQSRFESVFRGCLQDAERNHATIAKYDAALARRLRIATPAERKRLAEGRLFFAQLVDAFLPDRTSKQCATFAREVTRIPLNTP